MSRVLLVDRLVIDSWQDYLLLGCLVFVGMTLLIAFFRGSGPKR